MYKISDLPEIGSVLKDLIPKIDADPKKFLSPEGQVIFSIQDFKERGMYNKNTEYLFYLTKFTKPRLLIDYRETFPNGLIVHHSALEVRENSHDFNVIFISPEGVLEKIMYHPNSEELNINFGGLWGEKYKVQLPQYKSYDDMDAWIFQQSTIQRITPDDEEIMKFFMLLQKCKTERKRLPKFSISFEYISLDDLVELYD